MAIHLNRIPALEQGRWRGVESGGVGGYPSVLLARVAAQAMFSAYAREAQQRAAAGEVSMAPVEKLRELERAGGPVAFSAYMQVPHPVRSSRVHDELKLVLYEGTRPEWFVPSTSCSGGSQS